MKWISTYITSHIDFGTLAILFCLMGVVAGFQKLGYIDGIAKAIIEKSKNMRMLLVTMTIVCFLLSMLVTNDVALIIMVPFAIRVLESIGREDKLIKLVVLQTIAANLGSMLTPIGNPQNVYLYQYYEMQLVTFFGAVLPYGVVSFLLLIGVLFIDQSGNATVTFGAEHNSSADIGVKEKCLKTVIYFVLFIVCLACVLDVIHWFIMFLIVVLGILICDYRLVKRIDYGLLIKFVFLFLLVGNVAGIPWIKDYLASVVSGNEFVLGVLFSQFLSNVPAAIMMSKFTLNGVDLLLGVNVGGLGTLIASMASIISLEYFTKAMPEKKKQYVLQFTGYNLLFLAALCIVRIVF